MPAMTDSKTNKMSREEVLTAVSESRPEEDYVWDGEDEEDRPATTEELRAGVETNRRHHDRPGGPGPK